MREIRRKAMAKINLSLDVLNIRPDGYHELRTVMKSVSLCDELTLQEVEKPGITLQLVFSPGFSDADKIPSDERNLAYQAADLLMRESSVKQGLKITLKKKIPAAAGLAGGSSDAAAVLLGVNALFDLGFSEEDLIARAPRLGADVPFCVLGGTALAEGIGEKLTPLPETPMAYVLLAKPPVSVSTRSVYEHLHLDETIRHPDIDGQIRAIKNGDLHEIADTMGNVLEQVSIPLHPVIREISKKMRRLGALSALMSGSGPTVFGLFEDAEKAGAAYETFLSERQMEAVFLAEFV